MAPLFLFLASSLNVELVYSILKGITQFGYITLCHPDAVKPKLDKMHSQPTPDGMQLTLFKIKIKNYKHWDEASYQDFLQDNWVKRFDRERDNSAEEILVLDYRVKVTFHKMPYFKKLYELWDINDFQNFYKSLSPKFNRDMIFKAGESAGRSGSFFFFSHDGKYINHSHVRKPESVLPDSV